MIVWVHEDGRTEAAADVPHAFLPDGTGFRLRLRFIQFNEGIPTYHGLRAAFASYNDVKSYYVQYADIPQDINLAGDIDFDVSCFVAGTHTVRGRSDLFDVIDAGTLDVTIIDHLGLFDPRWGDTVFGPGRRIRTGTWVRLELFRPHTFTGTQFNVNTPGAGTQTAWQDGGGGTRWRWEANRFTITVDPANGTQPIAIDWGDGTLASLPNDQPVSHTYATQDEWVVALIYGRPYQSVGWVPVFTGLVDDWTRKIDPEGDSQVSLSCTDFFIALASGRYSGNVVQQATGSRIRALMAPTWQSKWGAQVVANGSTPMYAETYESEVILDKIRAAAQLEDGRVYITPGGAFVFETGTWRNQRVVEVIVLGRGAEAFKSELALCTYNSIRVNNLSYNALKDVFLVYNDMRICRAQDVPGQKPIVCASSLTVADTDDDLANQIIFDYQPPGDPAPARVAVVAQDAASIKQYGLRAYSNSDMTPTTAGPLTPLANVLLNRWKTGTASATQTTIDLLMEPAGTDALLGLQSGDLVETIDQIPAMFQNQLTGQYEIATSEVMQLDWSIGPTAFVLTMTLDEERSGETLVPGVEVMEATSDINTPV